MDLYIERIKPLFESSGMTDKDIEEALNLPRGVIYKWGIGKNKSYKRFIPEIAKYFNVSADYLMGLDSPSAGIKKERPADGEALTDMQKTTIDLVKSMSDADLKLFLDILKTVRENSKRSE